MSHGKFVTTINCMDGRVQMPVIQYLLEKYEADYVDSITEPGPDKILAFTEDEIIVENIKKRVDISVNQHGSRTITIVGHYDCAGNPVDEKTHKEHVLKSIDTIKTWNMGTEILGLYVDENWQVHEVK